MNIDEHTAEYPSTGAHWLVGPMNDLGKSTVFLIVVIFALANSGCGGIARASDPTTTTATSSRNSNTVTDNTQSLLGSGTGSVSTSQAVQLSIFPTHSTVGPNGTVQFSATVNNASNTALSWSVVSGGGTVSASGLYTAPPAGGTATVQATSVSDPNSSALANVTISSQATTLLSPWPASVAFGSVVVGGSVANMVTLTNTGNSVVTVYSATVTGSGFSLTGLSFPFTLAAGSSQRANVTFTPASSGPASGSVYFVSSSSNSPATVALSGSGMPQLPHSVALSWQPGTSTISGYNVYRGSISGGPYTRLSPVVGPISNFLDTTVQSGQTYYYVVTLVDSSGMESAYSNQVQATIPTP